VRLSNKHLGAEPKLVYLSSFGHAANYGRPHDTEFVPLLRATIYLVTGYALQAVGLFIMRGTVNTAAGITDECHPVLQIIHKYC